MSPAPLDGDRPLSDVASDRLGFSEMAEALAKSILAQTPTPGLVIGLEGAWGSGKSSLLNLTLLALRGLGKAHPVKVIEFRPWLIGDRDQLLTSLFGDLANAIDQIEADSGDITGESVAKAKAVSEGLRQFASRLAGPGKLLTAAGLLLPGMQHVGSIVEAIAAAASLEPKGPSLPELKDEVSTALKRLGVPIVVTIDDVDRLEPAEVIELLRLVRSVADLPNVIYLLCYDHGVLTKAIEAAASVTDGAAFLEKIVQVVVQAPIPEPYDLRHWFALEVEALTGEIGGQVAARVQQVIDSEGGRRLTTPRAVVRTLNSLRFDWPAVAGKVDLGDFIWLHLIKASNSSLYRWIEAYVGAFGSTYRSRTHLTEAGIARDNATLIALLESDGRAMQDEVYSLANHLPGIRQMYGDTDDDNAVIYGEVPDWEREASIRDKRLSSPDHYRLYFALSTPAVVPRPSDFVDLDSALADSPISATALLLKWTDERSTLGVSRAEFIFDRLRASHPLSEKSFRSLWLTFADNFDGPLAGAVSDTWGRPRLWQLAEPIIAPGLASMPATARRSLLLQTFKRGKALSWLADFFRGQLLAHGRTGSQRSTWKATLDVEDLDAITPIIMKRLEAEGVLALLERREGVSTLLAWVQGAEQSAGNSARIAIARVTATDKGLLDMLGRLRSQVMSKNNDGSYRIQSVFRRDYVDLFLDYDQMIERLHAIAMKPRGVAKRRAQKVLDEIEHGQY